MTIFAFFFCLLVYPQQAFSSLVETQTFEPSTARMDFLGVESARMMPKGAFDIGVLSDVATNTLARLSIGSSAAPAWELDTRDRIWAMHLSASFGLSKRLSVAMLASGQPLVLLSEEDNLIYKQTQTLQRVNLNLKLNLFDSPSFALALLAKGGAYINDDNPFFAAAEPQSQDKALPLAEGHLLLSFGQKLQLGMQAGYGWRQTGEDASSVLGQLYTAPNSYYIAKVGLAYGKTLRVFLEGFAFLPLEKPQWDLERSPSTAEALLGVRASWGEYSHAFAAIGSELLHGAGSADYRAVFGYRWNLKKPSKSKPAKKKDLAPAIEIAEETQPADSPPARQPNPLIDQPDYRVVLKNIRFAPGSSVINTADERTLAELQKSMELIADKSPRFIVLEGHTDSVGQSRRNMELSRRRAEAVHGYLLQNTAAAKSSMVRFSSYGYGENKPAASNATADGRSKNRRVELLFYP